MQKINKIIPIFITTAIFTTSVVSDINAAPPNVSTDEAVYVNLDYYGVPTGTTIVKGTNLNGINDFTDYGEYEKVSNMTGYDEPILDESGVHWKLSDTSQRFYYECTPKDNTIILPWNFDVSYKLNGVPKKGEELAGVSGLVEINIECIPNENSKDYYQNNMLLQAAMMIDMDKSLSIDAPGAQIQSIGGHKAVIFAALPGESTTFTIRIGTNSFETSGIVMMMIPGTLDQLKNIKDLKEAKDTVKDSTDAIYDSLDEILSIAENVSGGIQKTQKGLKELNSARQTISSGKNTVYDNAQKALDDLNELSEKISTLVPHLQNAQLLIDDVNQDLNELSDTANSATEHITDLSSNIESIQSDIEKLQKMLSDFNDTKGERQEIVDSLKKNLKLLKSNLNWLGSDLAEMSSNMGNLAMSTKNMRGSLSLSINMPSIPSGSGGASVTAEGVPDINAIMQVIMEQVRQEVTTMMQQVVSSLSDTASLVNAASDKADYMIDDLVEFMDSTKDCFNTLKLVTARGEEISEALQDTINLMDTYFALLDENYENTDKLLEDANKIGSSLIDILDTSKDIITETTNLNDTLNKYKDDAKLLLEDSEEITNTLINCLNSANEFLSSLKNLVKTAGSELDSGTEKTLNGLVDVLEKGLEVADTTPTLKNANDTIKKTIDDEINKFEDENKFLNLDSEMEMVSFTSDKNPSPESIQVILRTEEISLDNLEVEIKDAEIEEIDIGMWERIINVLKKILESIKSIF